MAKEYLKKSIEIAIELQSLYNLAERYHAGFTPGDGFHRLYFKKGHGPAQSINIEYEFVEPKFLWRTRRRLQKAIRAPLLFRMILRNNLVI